MINVEDHVAHCRMAREIAIIHTRISTRYIYIYIYMCVYDTDKRKSKFNLNGINPVLFLVLALRLTSDNAQSTSLDVGRSKSLPERKNTLFFFSSFSSSFSSPSSSSFSSPSSSSSLLSVLLILLFLMPSGNVQHDLQH